MARKIRNVVAAAFTSLALSGCASYLGETALLGSTSTVEGRSISYRAPDRTGGPASGPIDRLFVGECTVSGGRRGAKFLGAATLLLPELTSRAVDLLVGALRNAAQERAVAVYAMRPYSTAASSAQPFRGPGPVSTVPYEMPDCVQFVRGEFYGDFTSFRQSDVVLPGFGRSWRRVRQRLAESSIFLKTQPDFFFEARIIPSPDRERFILLPTYISFGRTFDSGASLRQRGLFIEFGANIAPVTMTDSGGVRGFLTIGNMTAGEHVRFNGPNDPRLPRMHWTAVGGHSDGGAINFEMRVIEVRDASPILAEIAGALETEAPGIKDRVRRGILPTTSDELADISAKERAVAAYDAAVSQRELLYAQFLSLQQAVDSGVATPLQRKQLTIVKRQLDLADRRIAILAREAGL